MSFLCRALVVVLASLALAGAMACGGAEQPAAKPAATPPPTAADVKAHMDDHFGKVEAVQEAVLRGDLADVIEPATWLAEHQQVAGLPASLQPQIDEMKKAAKAALAATDIKGAAQATASMALTCGACHTAANAKPALAAPAAPAATATGTASHMLADQMAVDLMYQGLVGPSDEAWKKGARQLGQSPLTLKDLPKDPQLTKEIAALVGVIHTLADKADAAVAPNARATLYGDVIATCAECHGLHGKVWGPGLPKK